MPVGRVWWERTSSFDGYTCFPEEIKAKENGTGSLLLIPAWFIYQMNQIDGFAISEGIATFSCPSGRFEKPFHCFFTVDEASFREARGKVRTLLSAAE